jgi:energy-coupling factor transport system permease protein
LSGILCLAHPAARLFYFAGFLALFFLFAHPAFMLMLWAGAFACAIYTGGRETALPSLRLCLAFAAVMGIFNMLLNHRGVHVIVYVAGRRFTWEALCYGISLAFLFSGLLTLFTALNRVLSAGQLLGLTARALPQTSFILSMTLRYAGYLQRRAENYWCTQSIRAAAAEGSEAAGRPERAWPRLRRLRRHGRLLNGFIAWSIEDGMQSVETLRAKEYGQRRRTIYTSYAFRLRDMMFLGSAVILLAALILLRGLGAGTYDYFRALAAAGLSAPAAAALALLAVYAFFPFLWDGLRGMIWK